MCDTFCGRINPTAQVVNNHEAVKYASESCCNGQKLAERIEGVDRIEVTGEGSKLMMSMKLPTVFIRMLKGDLIKSKVYYCIIQSESEQDLREIPAVLLSNPLDVWTTQSAELLPLCVQHDVRNPRCASLTPMLLRLRWKRMFSRGSSFKVKAIKGGRSIDQPGKIPWNVWNLNLSSTRMMITEKIYQDIREIPSDMIKRVLPPKSNNNSTPRIRNSSISSVSLSQASHKENLSTHYPNLKLTGLTASGGSSFAKWFRHLPPDIHVDKNFECDHGTILGRDQFEDLETFFNYLSKE